MTASVKSVSNSSHVSSKWIDVTMSIRNGMVHWPGDLEVEIARTSSIEKGDDANVTALHMSAHTATHVDAPLHFISGGSDVTAFDLDTLIGLAKVFFIRDTERITLDEIRKLKISEGDRVIFKTRNSEKDWAMLPFQKNYIYLETDAAQFLCDKGIISVGVDYLSVAGKENSSEVHKLLLEKEIIIIEGLMLDGVEEGDYEMICLPLKIENADGAPARVIIRKI
jgi:arylformamidase